MTKPISCPRSSTSVWITLFGLACYLAVLPLLRFTKLSAVDQALIAMLSAVVPIIVLDLAVLKVHRRESTGLVWGERRPINWGRSGVKLVGLAATLICIGLAYWVFHEYRSSFYEPFWQLVRTYGPWVAPLVVPYFAFVDSRMRDPYDGYWHLGMVALGRSEHVSKPVLVEHVRGWVIKGFFLPLMFVFLSQDIAAFHRLIDGPGEFTFFRLYDSAFLLLYTIDGLYATVGYILMFRLIDAHLRWTEPTLIGWAAALVCYQPFWDFFYGNYWMYATATTWGPWLSDQPVLKVTWGAAIIFLLWVYAWASVQFGCRFSNLTHRGVITNGPYRFTKHPAYVSKNLTWWLISVPWVVGASVTDALKSCLLLLVVNAIYFLRARTEERHMSRDPVYAAYCEYIDKKGVLRWVGRAIPLLRYKAPQPPGAVPAAPAKAT